MIIRALLGVAGCAVTLLSAPLSAAVYKVTYAGSNVFGPSPFASATLHLTTEDVINSFGGYFVTGISGDVDGDAVTELLPFEGPSTCSCFSEGYAALGGALSISNTLYLGNNPFSPGQLLDHGGLGFKSAANYYDLYAIGDDTYELLGFPTTSDPSDDLPEGFSVSDGVAAVPEAATWAMMIVGFGAVGTSLRQRRRASFAAA